jgi:hypothetical protein
VSKVPNIDGRDKAKETICHGGSHAPGDREAQKGRRSLFPLAWRACIQTRSSCSRCIHIHFHPRSHLPQPCCQLKTSLTYHSIDLRLQLHDQS